jgi:hypothetical protein
MVASQLLAPSFAAFAKGGISRGRPILCRPLHGVEQAFMPALKLLKKIGFSR